ncbi:conjugal transfer protein TraH [Escherichia coli]|uniref:conjugal transfer protein TraH n=1 Tax=Escherichia coli TaxID=562 RepID=UPI001317E9E8|nr:protein of unknown function [Escherichia coli]
MAPCAPYSGQKCSADFLTLPDINAGCGGIDAYLGSFSFINGEQLQRFVKQIMSNAAGYF